MALYQEHSWVDTSTFLAALLAFAVSNGWTSVESDSTHFKISKNGLEWHLYQYDAYGFKMTATVGGVTSPEVWLYRFDLSGGTPAVFYACGNGLVVFSDRYYNASNYYVFGGVLNIGTKVGSWSGGAVLHGAYSTSSLNTVYFLKANMAQSTTVFVDGAWSSLGTAAEGRPRGTFDISETINLNPNFFNALNTPVPIAVYLYDANTAYYHPLGVVAEAAMLNPGDLYLHGDVLTIGGQDCIFNDRQNIIFKLS